VSSLRIEWLLVAVELVVVTLAAVKIRKIVRLYRRERPGVLFAPDALEASLRASLKPALVASLLTSELTLPYYAVAAWFRKPSLAPEQGRTFTHHRRGGYPAVVLAVVLAVVAETLAAHVLLSMWTPIAAWIFTGLGVYGLLWIVGDYHALRLQPTVIDDVRARLRIGMRWRTEVVLSGIEAVHRTDPNEPARTVKLAVFGRPDLWIQLKEPVEVQGLFGIRRTATLLGVAADDPEGLIRALTAPSP